MTVYMLIIEQDTDDGSGSSVKSFTSMEDAQAAMKQDFEETLESWKFDRSEEGDEHYCEISEEKAEIRDGTDIENWRIEAQELSVEMAVEVKGGLVQNIYATADISPEVYDLDVSSYPDEGEQDEADRKTAELNKLKRTPGWRRVW